MRKSPFAIAIATLASACYLNAADTKPSFQTHEVVPEKELLITAPAVVDSPLASYPGPFSFGHLVEQLAEPDKAGEFVLQWLESWEGKQKVNGQNVAARPDIAKLVIDPWMEKDGFKGRPRNEWEIDLANAPFRLLAIVNRIDTGPFVQYARRDVSFGTSRGFNNNVPVYYSSGPRNTGEGRLVYGVTDQNGEPLAGGFTVIFEYRLPVPPANPDEDPTLAQNDPFPRPPGFIPPPRETFSAAERTIASRLQAARYAARWHALGRFENFDDAYLCELSTIVSSITARPANPAGSSSSTGPALAQLRTNEGALGAVQEAREFGYASGKLTLRPVASTPALAYNDADSKFGKALSRYINANQKAILAHTHSVPTTISDPSQRGKKIPFQAGSSLMPKVGERAAAGFRWDEARVLYSEALRNFSLNTCSGCHCGETSTEFYHIAPRRAGEESKLSKFLRLDDSEHTVASLGARKREIPLDEMHQRKVLFKAILNPHYDERKIRDLMRKRGARAH